MKRTYCCLILRPLAAALFGQNETGELRLTVTDPAGMAVASSVELSSSSNDYRRTFATDQDGRLESESTQLPPTAMVTPP